ncbi:hypothetical protein PILCRDRAFT_828691 [Piloderma croceum F 1598]|uniref:Uncharacterized protein n=1 Tax=Piloderma croceum (strain F 1598) TaxID=765440 RepID=A0A0C3AJB7_PILCF|nr:hypothetical protein PILCRDRAFT_828691 [Piloderma croceum F 1598]
MSFHGLDAFCSSVHPNSVQNSLQVVQNSTTNIGFASTLDSPSDAAVSDSPFNDTESSFVDTASLTHTSIEVGTLVDPCYLFFRVFDEDGAIPTKNPPYSGDPYLGRIEAKSVCPPHTVASVRFRLAKAEGFDNRKTRSTLFLTISSPSPMNDDGRVDIFSGNGPGAVPHEPLALCIGLSRSNINSLNEGGEFHDILSAEPHYIYYRLYTYEGEIQTKHPIDSQDISLARIDANLITPPHTTNSVKRFISRYEGDSALALGNLFDSVLSDHPMNNDYISILSGDGPGCRPEQPMAIVHINDQDSDLVPHLQENDSSVPTSQEECLSKPGYYQLQNTFNTTDGSAEAESVDRQLPRQCSEGDLCSSIRAQGRWLLDIPGWLTYIPGDILYTDGIVKQETFNASGLDLPEFYNIHSGISYPVYTARNSSGHIGLVYVGYFN